MVAHRDELLAGSAEFGSDFIPVYSDIKSFAEAQSALDYLLAAMGVFPPAKGISTLLHGAEVALKKGDLAEVSKLINKASDEISGYLPSPGKTSLPSSGVGANAEFSISNARLGKKLGKHVEDFGGDVSNATDRQRVLDIINDIGSNLIKLLLGNLRGKVLKPVPVVVMYSPE